MRTPVLHPLVVSTGVHAAVLVILLALAGNLLPAPPSVLRMHLVSSGPSSSTQGGHSVRSLGLPTETVQSPQRSPESAVWIGSVAEITQAISSDPVYGVPSADLDELLGGVPSRAAATGLPAPTGWAPGTQTEGHDPPPIPPQGLIPPQGARWSVSFLIPAAGGYPLEITGLDGGHEALDSWLETWLRDATFPASVNGETYRLKWVLVLDVGRPE